MKSIMTDDIRFSTEGRWECISHILLVFEASLTAELSIKSCESVFLYFCLEQTGIITYGLSHLIADLQCTSSFFLTQNGHYQLLARSGNRGLCTLEMTMNSGMLRLLVAVVLYCVTAVQAFTCPNYIYAFGDSLTDTGNAQAELPAFLALTAYPYGINYKFPDRPCERTRFCDGRLILDYTGMPLASSCFGEWVLLVISY